MLSAGMLNGLKVRISGVGSIGLYPFIQGNREARGWLV